MPNHSTFTPSFDSNDDQSDFFGAPGWYELVDEHEHSWEMIGRGLIRCWYCTVERRLPRQRSRASEDRRKPGER